MKFSFEDVWSNQAFSYLWRFQRYGGARPGIWMAAIETVCTAFVRSV